MVKRNVASASVSWRASSSGVARGLIVVTIPPREAAASSATTNSRLLGALIAEDIALGEASRGEAGRDRPRRAPPARRR